MVFLSYPRRIVPFRQASSTQLTLISPTSESTVAYRLPEYFNYDFPNVRNDPRTPGKTTEETGVDCVRWFSSGVPYLLILSAIINNFNVWVVVGGMGYL